MKHNILIVSLFVMGGLAIQGCRWRDDFRDAQQPQYLEQLPAPTLNVDSKDYEGDDTHVLEDIERYTPLPDIDGLSRIPEVPEYPAGM